MSLPEHLPAKPESWRVTPEVPGVGPSFTTAFRTFSHAHQQAQGRSGAGVSLAEAPFSVLYNPARLEHDIDHAMGLDALADLGFQALNPEPRHARGASQACCVIAWELWAKVQWVISAAPDHTLVTFPGSGRSLDPRVTDRDVAIPPDVFAAWQWSIAQRLIKALALPTDVDGLTASLDHFQHRLRLDLRAWAKEHHPDCLASVPVDRTRIEIDRIDGQVEVLTPLYDDLAALMTLLLGEDLVKALSERNDTVSPRAFVILCDRQKLGQKQETEALRVLHLAGEIDAANILVNQSLPPEQQTMTGLGAWLANRFGLRAVSIHPMGGARRAQQELRHASGVFESLAAHAQLPAASLGLGGLHLSLAEAPWATGSAAVAFFRPNIARGPRSHALPGDIVFSAPLLLSTLAHEWTHAWDQHLAGLAQPLLPKDQHRTLVDDLDHLRTVLRFEAPVSPATARTYRRPKEKDIRRALWDDYGMADGEFLTLTCAQRGTPATQARAAQGLLPLGFDRELRHLWATTRIGSEKAIRAALKQVLSHFTGLTEDRILPSTFAMTMAMELMQARKPLQELRAVQAQHPEWGPMRWDAVVRDRVRKTPYWSAPHELMARAVETFFREGTRIVQPQRQDGYPWGEEAARAHAAITRFFVTSRPAFVALAHHRAIEGPVVAMVSPSQELQNFVRPPGAVLPSSASDHHAPTKRHRPRMSAP